MEINPFVSDGRRKEVEMKHLPRIGFGRRDCFFRARLNIENKIRSFGERRVRDIRDRQRQAILFASFFQHTDNIRRLTGL